MSYVAILVVALLAGCASTESKRIYSASQLTPLINQGQFENAIGAALAGDTQGERYKGATIFFEALLESYQRPKEVAESAPRGLERVLTVLEQGPGASGKRHDSESVFRALGAASLGKKQRAADAMHEYLNETDLRITTQYGNCNRGAVLAHAALAVGLRDEAIAAWRRYVHGRCGLYGEYDIATHFLRQIGAHAEASEIEAKKDLVAKIRTYPQESMESQFADKYEEAGLTDIAFYLRQEAGQAAENARRLEEYKANAQATEKARAIEREEQRRARQEQRQREARENAEDTSVNAIQEQVRMLRRQQDEQNARRQAERERIERGNERYRQMQVEQQGRSAPPGGPCPDPTQVRLVTGVCYGDGRKLDTKNTFPSDDNGPSPVHTRPRPGQR